MAGCKRSFVNALVCAVLIGCSCAAPASEENDINYWLRENGEDSATDIPGIKPPSSSLSGENDEPEGSNQGSALQAKTALNTAGSRTDIEAGDNSAKMKEPESSNPQPQSATTTTTRAPQARSTTENQLGSSSEDTHSSTTEHPHNVIGRIYSPQLDKPARITFAGGVHQFRVRNDEDENKRAVEEYNYHFVRVEQGLPPTTKRGDKFKAP